MHQPTHAPPPANRRLYADWRLWSLVAILITAAIAVQIVLRVPADGLERFPHAFLRDAGYDPAGVTVVYAPIEAPPQAPDGCLPAWRCNDAAFNDAQGRPWLFPLTASGETKPTPPKHPRLNRSPDLDQCALYRTPEAQAMLDAYRTRRSP